jgi:AraC-like DNA-binding protein
MTFYTLPKAFYHFDGVKQILSHEDNCILHKVLKEDVIDAEALMTSHAIVYVAEGKAQVNTYDGEEVHIHKGEMLFMPRDSYVISDYTNEGKEVEVYLFFFNHEIALKFLATQTPITDAKEILCKLNVSKNIHAYLKYICDLEIENIHDNAFLELKLLELLHLIIQKDKEPFISTLQASEQNKQKRDISELMETYFDKNLSIKDYAALSGRSLSTFNRIFKEKYNTTPKQWLIEKKIEKAKSLLETGKSVTDTAFEVGYSNVSHFIQAYKSVYNKTPKEMQQLL